MFTPIHRALGLPAGDLTYELIDLAVAHGVQECSDLDWKAKAYNPKEKPKWEEEAAKDLSLIHI